MSEIPKPNRIRELKREITIRTLYPDVLEDYRPEDERSEHIDQLKDELQSLGVDAKEFQVEVVVQNLGLQVAGEVIEVVFPKKAG